METDGWTDTTDRITLPSNAVDEIIKRVDLRMERKWKETKSYYRCVTPVTLGCSSREATPGECFHINRVATTTLSVCLPLNNMNERCCCIVYVLV